MQTESQVSYLNLPNSLSIVRIGTAPVLVVLLLSPGKTLSLISAAVFGAVCATDWLDGYLARKKGIITSLGKFLDPLADKLLITTAFIMLIPLGRVPAWIVALMIGREMAVTGLRAIASNMGVVMAASTLGKLKTVAQIVCLVPLIIHYKYFGIDFHFIGSLFLIAAFVLTIWSGLDYFLNFFKKYNFPGD
ncbi:MAG: CDP-diacylglycerol--glycerol-3-phosphate 3-phosphatidyltransferase [Deltaproteobacteria bacterium]|nr:CDP-diacylglycerol--glycerol-3-phosphate 3-phosphatidyltransferase [Deltaproteobacteria bacterium]